MSDIDDSVAGMARRKRKPCDLGFSENQEFVARWRFAP